MKYTLLEMVQMILSSLDGDEVNSISDTVEAAQIATILKNSYFDIISSLDLPEHNNLFELTASTSSTPIVMYRPVDVTDIKWIRYNNYKTSDPQNNFVEVKYMDLHQFLDISYKLDPGDDIIETCTLQTRNSDTLNLNYRNDMFPTFYTTFDDSTVLFNGYMASEDSFLQKNKTQAYGSIIPGWTNSNTFVPNLDAKQFTLLLNEAKAQAFIELKQQQNPKAEKRARRGWIEAQRTKDNVIIKPNYRGYGRK